MLDVAVAAGRAQLEAEILVRAAQQHGAIGVGAGQAVEPAPAVGRLLGIGDAQRGVVNLQEDQDHFPSATSRSA